MIVHFIKRDTILRTRKSFITEVRGRTGGCSQFTKTTRVETLCVKRGIILQTRKSLKTDVQGRSGVLTIYTNRPGENLMRKKAV